MNSPNMSYEELRVFLNGLKQDNDSRLEDTVMVYAAHDGEYRPADINEISGDDILDDGRLFLMTTDEY